MCARAVLENPQQGGKQKKKKKPRNKTVALPAFIEPDSETSNVIYNLAQPQSSFLLVLFPWVLLLLLLLLF